MTRRIVVVAAAVFAMLLLHVPPPAYDPDYFDPREQGLELELTLSD